MHDDEENEEEPQRDVEDDDDDHAIIIAQEDNDEEQQRQEDDDDDDEADTIEMDHDEWVEGVDDDALVGDDEDDDEDDEETAMNRYYHPNNGEYVQQLLRLPMFEVQCDMMRANDDTFVRFYLPLPVIDDAKSMALGRALVGNTFLQELNMGLDSSSFTTTGVRSLMGGILGSAVKTLVLRSSDEFAIELSSLYVILMQHGNSTVESLTLAFPLDDEHARILATALTGNRTITTLDVDVTGIRSCEAAAALACGLRHSGVTHLRMEENPSGPAVATNLMEIMYLEGVKGSPTIRHLAIERIGGAFPEMLSVIPTLCTLELHRLKSLTMEQIHMLNHALLALPLVSKLETLVIVACGLQDEHMRILSNGIGNCKSLQHLNLERNYIGNDAFVSCIEHWSDESVMHTINFSSWEITPEGVKVLLDALPRHPCLKEIHLNGCHKVGWQGVKIIGESLAGKKLTTLSLNATAFWTHYINAQGEKAMLQQSAAKALLQGMRQNVYLQQLHIKGLDLPIDMQTEMDFYLRANRFGRSLMVLEQRQLPSALWCHVLVAHQQQHQDDDGISLMFLFLRELPTLMMMRTTTTSNPHHDDDDHSGVSHKKVKMMNIPESIIAT